MDHRTVPVEVVREFARSQAELSSIRFVAEDAGVGRSTLHKFISAGTMPHPRVRRLLALWYLRLMSDGVDETELIRPYVSALDTLVADVPDSSRRSTIMEVLESVDRGYSTAGEEKPRWVKVLRTRMSRTGYASYHW